MKTGFCMQTASQPITAQPFLLSHRMKPAFCTQQHISRGAAAWRTDTLDVIQGVYYDSGYNSSLNWNRGCMWFSMHRTCCRGVQSRARRLRFTAKPAPVPAQRRASTCVRSRIPLQAAHPALPGTMVLSAPSVETSRLRSRSLWMLCRDWQTGYYGGLCLYETPYNFGSSTYSNAYMRMSGRTPITNPISNAYSAAARLSAKKEDFK